MHLQSPQKIVSVMSPLDPLIAQIKYNNIFMHSCKCIIHKVSFETESLDILDITFSSNVCSMLDRLKPFSVGVSFQNIETEEKFKVKLKLRHTKDICYYD